MSDTDTVGCVHRALTDGEMAVIAAAIDAESTAAELVPATARALYAVLDGRPWSSAGGEGAGHVPLWDRARFALPEAQWLAIAETCIARAEAFGAGVHAALGLHHVMPARYTDPAITVTSRPRKDHRPAMHDLSVTREAVDVIAAASRYCEQLARFFGVGSDEYLDAVRSWQCGLSQVFAMQFGVRTRVVRADELSLTVTSETTGFAYGLHFRPDVREHIPSRTPDAPDPGRWLSVYCSP